MTWFANLQMRSKSLLGFGFLCALLVGVATLGYETIARMQRIALVDVGESVEAYDAILQARADQNFIRSSMMQTAMVPSAAERAPLRSEIALRVIRVDSAVNAVKAFAARRGLLSWTAPMADLELSFVEFRTGRQEIENFIEAGRTDTARALLFGAQFRRFEALRLQLVALADSVAVQKAAAAAESERTASSATRLFAVVALTAVLLALFMVWLMNRLVAVPLRAVTGISERIAAGDLTMRVETEDRSDEIGMLQRTLRTMVDNLRGLNKELRSGFGVLASSSTEIMATVSQVATGATETATAVSETSTTAEEVKQTAHLANQKAKTVLETAQRAAAVSETGGKAVAATVEGMNDIREQMGSIAESVVRLSEQGQTIGEIIATVNDIAEQSNLLAVNAAIEATRAGEYGKGFAVVAQEVKSLAEQSRQATTQVRTILMEVQKATSAAVMATEQGTKAVAAGVKQATDAGEAIRALTGSVGDAAQAATQIAASSQQQLVGMDQISSALASIRQATTQNVAGTKQLEASAHDLQDLGARLKVLVERQRIEA